MATCGGSMVRTVESVAAMEADQAADEADRHEVGEVLLAVEAAIARVERALAEMADGSEARVDARRVLERAKTDLDHTRRRLQQNAYFPSPQRNLF